ncbi:hypothetical protein D3C72_421220 [compost metagenome]
MDPKFITQLSGREFVQYGGLLDEAHKQGLKEIRTAIVQVPTQANDFTAICTAEVVLERDGVRRVFTGVGDASPKNVNRNIAAHILRMAETRSKARALRDAINVGMCSVEELGPDLEAPEVLDERLIKQTAAINKPASTSSAPKPHAPGNEVPYTGPHVPISTKQIQTIAIEMQRVGWSEQQGRSYLFNQFGKQSRKDLTGAEATQMIDYLKALPTAPKAMATART